MRVRGKINIGERELTGVHFFQGNDACVEGAIAAGCNLFAGYPITPATEISERMSRRIFEVGGIFVQGADELDSLALVIGSVWGGWKAMTATAGNGICLMQENIGFSAMTETPCVIVDVQRAGPATGAATKSMQGDVYQVRYGSNADYSIIALAPNSPQEMFDLTVEAFNLAEIYRVPTFILADEIVGHMREKVIIPEFGEIEVIKRKKPEVKPEDFIPFHVDSDIDVPTMPVLGDGYRMPVSDFTHTETGTPSVDYEVHKKLITRLWNKVEKNKGKLSNVEEYFLEDSEIAVLSYGSVARSAYEAVFNSNEKGIKAGYLRLITLWPFPDRLVKSLAEQVKVILVPEMNMGKIVREVQRAAEGEAKVVSIPKPGIEVHTPDEIMSEIRRLI